MEIPNSETQQSHICSIYSPAKVIVGLIFTFFAISKIPHIKTVKIYLKLKQRKGDLKRDKSKGFTKISKPRFNVLAEKFGVHPAIIKILADRGVQGEDAVREYLEADIATVSDGSELTDMHRRVILSTTQCRQENISASWVTMTWMASPVHISSTKV